MRSFQKRKIESLTLPQEMVRNMAGLWEFKGKQDLYKQQSPQVLKNLVEVAVIQSTESSNRIEGITAPHNRIVNLLGEKTQPSNRPEQEILGYRYVLNLIHQRFRHIPFTPNVLLQLHGDMYRFTPSPGGRWKSVDNEIAQFNAAGEKTIRFEPVAAHLTDDAMNLLHESYVRARDLGRVDPILLMGAYILDFLCIHPFLDGNGRMARLLTQLLLYQSGFEVGRYISLEKIVEESKEAYYDALYESSQGWHEGEHDLFPWWKYLTSVLLRSYREFEERVGFISKSKGSKTGLVLEAIQQFYGEFSIRDIQEHCPNVGIDLIRRIMRQERQDGRLECLGKGPFARWRKAP